MVANGEQDWEGRLGSLELTNKSYLYKMDKQGHTYSAGNYIQYPVINRNEKNMKKNRREPSYTVGGNAN